MSMVIAFTVKDPERLPEGASDPMEVAKMFAASMRVAADEWWETGGADFLTCPPDVIG